MRQIEVFADIACPFAHVGFRRFVAERTARSHDEVRLHVRAWPLELINGEPFDGHAVANEIKALRDSVAPDLFRGFDAGTFPRTSLPAQRLANAAYSNSVTEGERVSLLLRTALFEDGRDISDPDILHDLLPGLDVDGTTPEADWQEGKARGVEGSPHFFLDGEDFFCPSMTISHEGNDLDIRFDDEGFTEFIERALSPA